jgi:hypothetical protein
MGHIARIMQIINAYKIAIKDRGHLVKSLVLEEGYIHVIRNGGKSTLSTVLSQKKENKIKIYRPICCY